MFHKSYQQMNEKIVPESRLQAEVLKKALPTESRRFRPLLTAAAVLLVILVAVPVMAYYVPPVNDLMHYVSPEMAQRFTPVQKSCESSGVRVEVISASIHENVAEICISVDDLTGDRITEQTIPGTFRIRSVEDFGQSVKSLNYDTQTGKKTFLIQTKALAYGTVADMLGKRIAVTMENLEDLGGTTVVEGRWRVTFEFTESDYVSPDDPYHFITSPEEEP